MKKQDVQYIVEKLPVLRDFIIYASEILSTPKEYADNVVNRAEMQTMQLLAASPGIKISDLALRRGRTLSAASRIVDILVGKGYVEKRKMPDNKKNICIFLTSKGEDIVAHYTECDKEKLEREAELLLEKYTVQQLDLFFDIAQTMHNIVREEEE